MLGLAQVLRRGLAGSTVASRVHGRSRIRPKATENSDSGILRVQTLKQLLREAVEAENYALAAEIRDKISDCGPQTPPNTREALQTALDDAIMNEQYEDAANLRDKLQKLQEEDPIPSTCSNVVTDGIRVTVESSFAPEYSMVSTGQYFFNYKVSIRNEGDRTVQLRNRHWLIQDSGTGKSNHVRGPGVVGEQPILRPGDEFDYTSACPLNSPCGTMEGEYEMMVMSEDGDWTDVLEVKIGKFLLDATGTAGK